jgi:2-polyprenyl-6-methoxyphenol hydroxylase-like FAD-dependent oxidoreductase
MRQPIQSQPLIVGAGPTGLAAALFLAARGIRAHIIDCADAPSRTSRAQVVNPRSLELLAASGVTDAVLAEGRPVRGVKFYEDWEPLAVLDFTALPSSYAMTVLPQVRTEALLAQALARHGIAVERPVAFRDLKQAADGVDVGLGTPDGKHRNEQASIVLGADGAHSRVREALGVSFDGHAFPEPWPLYDVALADPLDLDHAHVCFVDEGLVFLLAIRPGLWRVFGDVPNLLAHLPCGARAGRPEWTSCFHVSDKRAGRIAEGLVALAGDAAHVQSPVGARGMNLGIEDAFVFAACFADAQLAQQEALERYARLRQPVHRRVVARMDRLTALSRGRPGWVGLLRHYLIPALAGFGPVKRPMQEFLTGLDQAVEVA